MISIEKNAALIQPAGGRSSYPPTKLACEIKALPEVNRIAAFVSIVDAVAALPAEARSDSQSEISVANKCVA